MRDELPDGVELVDLGSHRLRDLARPDRVFQVGAPGLADQFPPLRSLDAFPGNLPVQLTSFVGRDDELKSLAGVLQTARLVTLTGVGGVGKTRLAIQVAAEVLPGSGTGRGCASWRLPTTPRPWCSSSPRPLVRSRAPGAPWSRASSSSSARSSCCSCSTTASTCSTPPSARRRRARVVPRRTDRRNESRGLGRRRRAGVAAARAGDARGRAATRSAPGDVGPAVCRARGRGAPVVRARREQRAAVAEICRRLDGIRSRSSSRPRVASMSPAEIASRLDERFRLLTGGRRTAVERHQTLRATVDWSYSLLDERERLVFDRLGVFAGGFDAPSRRSRHFGRRHRGVGHRRCARRPRRQVARRSGGDRRRYNQVRDARDTPSLRARTARRA